MKEAVTNLRMLGVDMINQAQSGHPGIVLGAAPMMHVLWTEFINVDPDHPDWINRDRFILSAGHGSALLYSMLYFAGFDYKIDDLKLFRQVGSCTPGHPEYDLKHGVELTTGPLGQGVATGVGMALAEKMLSHQFNKPDAKLFDHDTYILCSDGDLQEGVSYEAMSLAGHLKLKKIIALYDSNDVQLDSMVENTQTENIRERCEALQWNYLKVTDGDDLHEIKTMVEKARIIDNEQPTLIEIKTIIGHGSPGSGTSKVHGTPLKVDELQSTRNFYQWPQESFVIKPKIVAFYQETIIKRGQGKYKAWQKIKKHYVSHYPQDYALLEKAIKNKLKLDLSKLCSKITEPQATRVSSGLILKKLNQQIKNMVGGSADLSVSTNVVGGDGVFSKNNLKGRNIMFGVREFAMGAINNGLTLHGGLLSFVSSFFCFTDYLKPALRLAALMKLPNWFIMTHDSFMLGEDGPTHEPVEQLAMCRAQPNTIVFRPADWKETIGAYQYSLNHNKSSPVVFVLSRQNTPQLVNSDIDKTAKGAYVVYGNNDCDIIITSTGTDVAIAIDAAKLLEEEHQLTTKIISMPSCEIFDKQPASYRQEIYQSKLDHLTVTYENAATLGWRKYGMYNIGIDHFGASGKAQDILYIFHRDPASIAKKVKNVYKVHKF